MKHLIAVLTIAGVLTAGALQAQQSPLTLEESVTGAWSTFAPERLNGLQWVKDSDG
jgi:hypothetical protein